MSRYPGIFFMARTTSWSVIAPILFDVDQFFKTILILVGVILAGLIAAGIIATILNTSITRRIVQLTLVTQKMRKGQMDVVAEEGSLDELGHLGKTFNFMAARMKGLSD